MDEYLRAGEHVFRHQRELQLGDPPRLIRPRSIFSGPMHHAHSLQFGAPLAGRCLSDTKPGVPMPQSSDTAPRSQPMNSKMKRRHVRQSFQLSPVGSMGYFDKHRRVSTSRTVTRAVSSCRLYGPRPGWVSQADIGPLSKAHVVSSRTALICCAHRTIKASHHRHRICQDIGKELGPNPHVRGYAMNGFDSPQTRAAC